MTQAGAVKNGSNVRARRLERLYPLILCCCRVVLALTQFSVAYDTCMSYKSLSRLTKDLVSTPLTAIADSKIDYGWVPVMESGDAIQTSYGKNKLFNYFIIRVVHFLHGQITAFILYPSVLTLVFMLLLSMYDVFEIYQRRYSKATVDKIGFWLHLSLYVSSIILIILQGVLLLFENGQIAHMEVLYPFLFAYGSNEKTAHKMLLRTGSRNLKRRLLACVLFNLGSLVPDTYLLLVRTLQPLRLFVIVNSIKVGCGLTIMAGFIVGFIVRYYIGAALDPKLLGDKTTINIWKHNPLINVNDYYPNTKWDMDPKINNSAYIDEGHTYLPVFDIPRTITSRVGRSTKNLMATNVTVVPQTVPKFFLPLPDNDPEGIALAYEKGLAVYTFVRNSFSHAMLLLNVFLSLSGYIGLSTLALGMFSFLLVLKRHKLLLYVNALVDAIAIVMHICNISMAFYPMGGAEFFCDIKEHIPAGSGGSFEAMTVYAWMCRSKELFNLVMGVAVALVLLSCGNMAVLYILWR